MNLKTLLLWTTCFALSHIVCLAPIDAKLIYLGTESSSKFHDADPLYTPKPEIPSYLQENAFKSFCVAKFFIDRTGTISVQLLSSSGSEEIDDFVLSKLKQWRFKPAMLDGEAIASTRKIRVEFEVN